VVLEAAGAIDNLAVYVGGGGLELASADVAAGTSAGPGGLAAALYATGALAAIEFRNGQLAATTGASPYAAYRAAGATLKIDNAMLTGTTFGAPLCFQTYSAVTFAPVAYP
jgi:hypothetical protein